jgi:hypothetical protein
MSKKLRTLLQKSIKKPLKNSKIDVFRFF